MLFDPFKEFQNKVSSLDIEHFFPEVWMRKGKAHYTEELGIVEGKHYTLNTYTCALLRRLIKASDITVRLFGTTVSYDENTNSRSFQYNKWMELESFSCGDGELPYEHFIGKNDDETFCMFVDDVISFFIVPTQKPINITRYQP